MEKSAILWNEFQEGLKFFVIDKDMRAFEDVFINSGENDTAESELSKMMFDINGEYRYAEVTHGEWIQALKNGAELVVCGFIP